MSRQNETKPSVETEASEIENKKEQPEANEAKRVQSRRSMIGAGFAGFASAIVAACSGSEFAGVGGGNRLKGKKVESNGDNFDGGGQDGVETLPATESSGPGEVEGTEPDPIEKPKAEIDRCAATTPQKVDTTGMASIENAPVVKIYGKRTSRMVAIQFSANTTFDQLLIANASGRLLALHIPTGADKNASGWRPIVIDPLNFDEGGVESAEIVIVIQNGSERKQYRETLTVFNKFDGKDVIDLSVPTASSGWEPTKQSVARFKDDKITTPELSYTGYLMDPNPSIIYPDNRKLKTAQQNLSLTISDTALKSGQKPIPKTPTEGVITDIMGNVLAYTDLEGNGLLETPLFCTYRPSTDGTKLIRTIIYVA